MKKMKNRFNRRVQIISGIFLGMIIALVAYYAPEVAVTGGVLLGTIPIWGSIADGSFKELTAEQLEELEPKQLAQYFNDLNAHREKNLKDLITQSKEDAGKDLKTEIQKLKDEIVNGKIEQLEALKKSVEEMGLALRKMTEGGKKERQSLSEYLTEHKDALVGIAHGKNGFDILEVKANTVRSNITDFSNYYTDPEIGQLTHRRLTFYDLFPKIPVGPGSGGYITYYDWDEATTVRSAAMIAEGGSYTESTAKWKWYSMQIQKVGDILPLSEEFDQDMPQFAAELELFLRTNVDLKVDTELFSGAGRFPQKPRLLCAGFNRSFYV